MGNFIRSFNLISINQLIKKVGFFAIQPFFIARKMNLHKPVLLLCLILIANNLLLCQKHTGFNADFTIKEIRKNTKNPTTSLMLGKVSYDSKINKVTYTIQFPKKETWVFQDSFLFKYRNDSLISKKIAGNVNEYLMFKNILEPQGNDFGMSQLGFTLSKVEEKEEEIFTEWIPPSQYKSFVHKVNTVVKDNLLTAIVITDINNLEITKSFYEGYEVLDGIPVPTKISSHFVSSNKDEIFKSLTFRNVEVN